MMSNGMSKFDITNPSRISALIMAIKEWLQNVSPSLSDYFTGSVASNTYGLNQVEQ
ncbi:hypothetical protein HC752_05730 [Vibrio sp. S9_S30]|uniref:hypothetical protein n=1 Tax=Vibrio sp. S9_S30 TaxID=2720226 RepID=UPI001680E990|nr:hypothetical protein [Vibrio sp. S9_S30]MBD1556429.1 hypothetical protein [Vibrio sp. S9_S30]